MVETDLLVSYAALLTMAVVPIYIGAHKSLAPLQVVDSLSAKDAYMFPVMGSVVLFSLYLMFKFLAKEWINFLLSSYFMLLGIGAIATALHPLLERLLPKSLVQAKPFKLGKLPKPLHLIYDDEIEFTFVTLCGTIVGTIVGAIYLFTKHWITNNILGEAFSIVSIEIISLGSFKIGCIMLVGLFFYDIFWVFGTDVMVTVARSFDAPIKVVWPRAGGAFSLLGLGDIVIPGIFIALMLRFDAERSKKLGLKSVQKTYFHACFIGYVIGLASTILVLHIFQAGQPALLYIVPAIIGSVVITAIARGEVGDLLAYHDPQPEVVAEDDSADETEGKSAVNPKDD